ncbi:GlcG/HbpS family heme-binding protein [Pantoea septica]|uniref:GlcG/HbpS family heme-binding protein n=1 Tax=Pantoea septica TaxID=472695 RepID=UPI00289F899D|nr:heme-binding protein [Pantoea septica]
MKAPLCSALCALAALWTAAASATQTQTILSAEDAQRIISRAEKQAQSLKAQVCIAVLDRAGQLLAFKRMDNAPPGCIDSSMQKGRAAALYRTSTDKYMARANGTEPAIATLPNMVPLGGGATVTINDEVTGAIGVSGTANPAEIAIADAGSKALNAP